MRIKSYRLYHEDFKFRDLLWFDLINVQEGYPEFCDIFDRHGEVAEDYQEGFNVDVYVLAHENVRITEMETLNIFLKDYANVPNELDEAIYDFLYTLFVNNSDHVHFQFSGDGDGLGFIVDVWDNQEREGEPVDSLQVWLDEYKQYM